MDIKALIADRAAGPIELGVDATVQDAAQLMRAHTIGLVLIVEGDRELVGVISERDIVRVVADGENDPGNLKAADVGTRNPKTCAPTSQVHHVLDRMREGGFRHMPVVDNGAVVGIVSASDLLRQFGEEVSPRKKAEMFDMISESGELFLPGM